MPVEVGIWKLGKTTERVQFTPMEAESRLEEILDGRKGVRNRFPYYFATRTASC